ncbi:hypothetical protein [Gloeothece verrucosa]|nr:hypothetical protein [Gloeothece verrucosa]
MKSSKVIATGELFNAVASVFNFIVSDLIGGAFTWSATKIWSILVAGAIFAFNFNWNIPDEDLEARFKQAEIAWYGQLGSAIGTSLGWLACGIVPSLLIMSFNEAMGSQILLSVGEEAYEEMISELSLLINMGVRNKCNQLMAEMFIGFRWLIKNAANGLEPDTALGGIATKVFQSFPKLKESAKSWGDKGSKPWVLSQKIEEYIESLPIEQKYQEFFEELLDSFGDSCIEAGYVVAGGIDEFLANQSVAQAIKQQPNTVVITPNRLAPNQKLILHGTTEQLKQSITAALANYQIVDGKDIGIDLGMPLIERAHKQISEYVITLFLKSKQKPPYGRDAKQHQIKLNSANKLKFTDFDKVIRALGGGGKDGNLGYMYGRFFGRAQMSDGSTLELWCDTSENVKTRIEAIAELSEATIQTLNITEEIKDYQRKKIEGLSKDIYRVYPWKVEVIRKTKVYDDYGKSFNDTTGNLKSTKQGYYDHSYPYTLELWQGQEPANWDAAMAELTKLIPLPNPI